MAEEQEDNRSILALEVTEEQREAIRAFYVHNEWDFNEIDIVDQNNSNSESQTETVEQHYIPQDPESDECEHCLCRPCITDELHRQSWLESESHAPNKRNSSLRKDKYKRFWTNLFHRRVWRDSRYLARKEEALSRDRTEYDVFHRRDLMPKCVVTLVRSWLPNPPNKPYIGHRWE
ncbi:hypothetical protein FSP39_017655 [Pinctada imbricata]|uniref:Uncharacterized protein n=1 Tax=Pinctada imbricata TaxID=66713 RepID=A0AA88YF70_PINIB|nr:hypothetical protein FSP39_017655 [Pinctada imbricata]